MASQITASCTCLCSSLATSSKPRLSSSLPLLQSSIRASKLDHSWWISQLGSSHFSPYIGLKHLGIPISRRLSNPEKKQRRRNMVVHASLFGVGAPEALVIGVVALLVFGPKGLAEVARNLGKTLRTFQPTIRELQDVSREFKSTLQREIGLDDISTPNTYNSNMMNYGPPPPSVDSAPITENPPIVSDPNNATSPRKAYTTEEYLKMTEEQIKASASQQSEQPSSIDQSQLQVQEQLLQPEGTVKESQDSKPTL